MLELVEIGTRRPQRLQRIALVALELLGQERDRQAAPLRELARVGDLLPREDPQQRRLAAAVRADHAQADARLDVQVEPVEDQARTEALADAACLQERHDGVTVALRGAAVVVPEDEAPSAARAVS